MKPIDKLEADTFIGVILKKKRIIPIDLDCVIMKLNQLISSHNKPIKIIEEQEKFFTIYEVYDKTNFIKLNKE